MTSADGRLIVRSLTRMHVAALPSLIFAVLVTVTFGAILRPGPLYGFVTVAIGGGGALLVYLRVARALGVEELPQLVRTAAGRFAGGLPAISRYGPCGGAAGREARCRR
ncbi:MAG TPA: hypothetical protein VE733_17165 [Streptosporangiaceae bacterium]|nr:hypothetical protein [Streptosporangiaceae bacterium]